MHKQIANKVLANLDSSANELERLASLKGIRPEVAAELTALAKGLDEYSDRLQVAAFGQQSLDSWKAKLSKVIQRDSDEKFMDTYDNPQKVIQSDADEKFLHKTDPSFNSKGIDNFDTDSSSAVTDRDEYAIRDLNDMAGGTKKQPTWTKGPAGKSTKQGSTSKTWSR